jgi:alpha-galactosidase/6-phospho-beta-glucosidase family protein
MTNTTKIVFLGAGSIAFGMSMLRDLFTTTEFSGSTLTLVTRHADSAVRVAQVAQLLIDPVVNSATAAAGLLDELWEVNRQYIRNCVA